MLLTGQALSDRLGCYVMLDIHTVLMLLQWLHSLAVQATLAACNVAATLSGHPAWNKVDVLPFVDGPFDAIPKAAPSIVNAKELSLKMA